MIRATLASAISASLRRAELRSSSRWATSITGRRRSRRGVFGDAAQTARRRQDARRRRDGSRQIREKDLEQSHVCLGTPAYPQAHDDRYASYVLNTVLGGSMSSRLFQNIREKRGLAYAVFIS